MAGSDLCSFFHQNDGGSGGDGDDGGNDDDDQQPMVRATTRNPGVSESGMYDWLT